MRGEHLTATLVTIALGAFVALGYREQSRYFEEQKARPYARVARWLEGLSAREACDSQLSEKRFYAASVVDRFRAEIDALWKERGPEGEPRFALLDLGAAKLRISPKVAPREEFDSSAWSWDEAYSLIRKTQTDPSHPDNKQRWRDVDSMVKFLLEKDVARIARGQKFLPPDITQHQFRPNSDVRRSGAKEFTVRLAPGDFLGHEAALQKLLEDEWRGGGWRVRIEWSQEAAYRMLAHAASSRSFVSHRKKTMEIANLAWTKTVAHELGHVIGFDDHYYNVWNARNCYYSQESRLADIMSSSEKGGLTVRHWQILDQAYPLGRPGMTQVFSYTYGK